MNKYDDEDTLRLERLSKKLQYLLKKHIEINYTESEENEIDLSQFQELQERLFSLEKDKKENFT